MNTVTTKRRVGSGLECQEYCAGIQGAEYFKWKKVRGGKERMVKCTVFRPEPKSAGASNLVSNQETTSKRVMSTAERHRRLLINLYLIEIKLICFID